MEPEVKIKIGCYRDGLTVYGSLKATNETSYSIGSLAPVWEFRLDPIEAVDAVVQDVPFVPVDDSEAMVAMLMHHRQQQNWFVSGVANRVFDPAVFDNGVFG
jgi:hypothetical protein